jgi:hypothetical protein
MNELGEGDIDIIKAPIVIDNVSTPISIHLFLGIWPDESRYWRRDGTISCFQLIVS